MSDILRLRGGAFDAHDEESPGTEFHERRSPAESPSGASGKLSLHMPPADELTPDELLYLRVYHTVLEDAGFVENPPGMFRRLMSLINGLRSRSRSNASILLLRRTRFVSITIALLCMSLVTIYLLVVSVRGHLDPVYQSRQIPSPEGLIPPLFFMCHNVFNIDQFNIASQDSDGALDYDFENFIDLKSGSPYFYSNERTRPLPPRYSPQDANIPSCFFHDLLPQLLGREKYEAQKSAIQSLVGDNSNFDKYVQSGAWKNCAICYAPFEIQHSLNMRFDFALPEDTRTLPFPLPFPLPPLVPSALRDNLYKIFRLSQKVFNDNEFFLTAFFGQLRCQNTMLCGEQEAAPYFCCMRNLYHPITPSTFTFRSVDLAPVPSTISSRFFNADFKNDVFESFRTKAPVGSALGLLSRLSGDPQEQSGAMNKQLWNKLLQKFDVAARNTANASVPGGLIDFINQCMKIIKASDGKAVPSLKPTLVAKMRPAEPFFTQYRLVPANTPIISQLGIIASLVSLVVSIVMWLTGVEVGYNRRLHRLFRCNKGDDMQQAVAPLLPPHLLQKLQRQKLVRVTAEDEQLSGRIFKIS